jgi:secretion/DNA translocation related TadE-like protein
VNRLRAEAGSAPAGVLAFLGTMLTVVAVLALLGRVLVLQASADRAADLSALAGADALAAASGEPCMIAAAAAQRNGAELTSCEVDAQDVVVRVRVGDGPVLSIDGVARAGPAP